MWPCRHCLISHQHSEVDCASMVGHTDQDWIADETWGQGYQLCSASQYPRSLTPFGTLLLARNVNKRKKYGKLTLQKPRRTFLLHWVTFDSHYSSAFSGLEIRTNLLPLLPACPFPTTGNPRTGGPRPLFVHINPKFPLGIRPSSIFSSTCHFLKYCHFYFGSK